MARFSGISGIEFSPDILRMPILNHRHTVRHTGCLPAQIKQPNGRTSNGLLNGDRNVSVREDDNDLSNVSRPRQHMKNLIVIIY